MNKKNGGPSNPEEYRLLEVPGHLMRRCQQRAVELYGQEVGDDGPTPRQFAVLVTAWQNPGINQTGIVNITGIDRSTIGELLGRLVRRGWLRRRRTATDARSNALYVTVAGGEIVKQVLPRVNAAQEKIMAPVPPDRRNEFLSYLRRIADLPGGDGTGTNSDLE